MLETRILRDVTSAERIADSWRELLERSSSPEPVQTPSWMLAWWRQFGDADRRSLRLVTFSEGGRLVGIAPLSSRVVMHRRAIPVRRLELLASGEDERDEICSDYVGAIVEAGREGEVAAELAKLLCDRDGDGLGKWDELLMPQMRADAPFISAIEAALGKRGAVVSVRDTGLCPYIALPKTWDEYLKELDSSRRYIVSRSLRELDKWTGKDGHTLRRAGTREELAEGRAVLRALHAERWEGEGETGVFASERFTRFHDEVMPRLLDGEGGTLDLLWLVAKGEPVAAIYNIVYRDKVYFYQSGRRLDVPKGVKIGIAIHALAIRRSIELGHREYDFLNGASQYKTKLALATRPLVTLRAVAPGLRARAVDAARDLTDRAIERVRQYRRGAQPARPGGESHEDAKAGS